MSRTIAVLGSTGSIGRQTLAVARELGLKVGGQAYAVIKATSVMVAVD